MPDLGVHTASAYIFNISYRDSKGELSSRNFLLEVTQSDLRALKCSCGWTSPLFILQPSMFPPEEILRLAERHAEKHTEEQNVSLTHTTGEIQ